MTGGRAAAVLFAVAASATARAERLDWAEVTVHRAWHARMPALFERLAGRRLVAVDVEVRSAVSGLFEPGQLALATGAGERPPALVLRLTGDGKPADPRDPLFAGEPESARLLLVAALPLEAAQVAVRLGGRPAGAAAAIAARGPALPAPSLRPVAHAAGGQAPLEGYRIHRVLVEARDWPRIAEPRALELAYALAGSERRAGADRWIEVDAGGRPLAEPLARRPTIVPVRRFILELWLKDGGRPRALLAPGWRGELPAAPLALTPEAARALARAEPDLDAAHYQ